MGRAQALPAGERLIVIRHGESVSPRRPDRLSGGKPRTRLGYRYSPRRIRPSADRLLEQRGRTSLDACVPTYCGLSALPIYVARVPAAPFAEASAWRAEDRGQRTEDRGRMSEVRGQKTKIVAFILSTTGNGRPSSQKSLMSAADTAATTKDLKSDGRGQIPEVRAEFNAR